MKVWVILEQFSVDDDGDFAVELIAVHASEEGAEADLIPDYATSGHSWGSRERYVVEMDVLP